MIKLSKRSVYTVANSGGKSADASLFFRVFFRGDLGGFRRLNSLSGKSEDLCVHGSPPREAEYAQI